MKKNRLILTLFIALCSMIFLSACSIGKNKRSDATTYDYSKEYKIACEVTKSFDEMLARDIIKTNLQTIDDSLLINDDPNDKYVVVTKELMQKMTKIDETNYTPVYYYLWSDDPSAHYQSNGLTFDNTNVEIKIYVLSKGFGYYKTIITVNYAPDKYYSYYMTHFSE